MKALSVFAATGFAVAVFASAAQAMPAAPIGGDARSGVTLVAGGCGPGWHRGPYGRCRPNMAPRPVVRCWWRQTPWGPRRICR
jgi:hypothetical protein